MGNHLWKSSESRFLLIADSQARFFEAGNLNIIALPGARIRNAFSFAPPPGKFDRIILFIGGNDLYEGFEPPCELPAKVARDLIEFANFLVPQTKEVFVLGIPERNQNKPRSKAVNDILEKTALRTPKQTSPANWKFRSVSTYISGARYYENDKIYLNSQGRSNLHNVIKEKTLYEKYIRELNEKGHLSKKECRNGQCTCAIQNW